MGLRIVEDHAKILQARDKLISAFRRGGAAEIKTVIGYPGGHEPQTVYWIKGLGIWLGCSVIPRSRFWNGFGTQDPSKHKVIPISCEINFPLSGVNRRISGAVAEDEKGRLCMVHRGQIGGGRKGIGSELFWRHFDGGPSLVVDGGRDAELIVVGSLESPRLLHHIQFFVREVERIKSLAHSPEEPENSAGNGEEEFDIKDIGLEFEGTKTYSVTRKIEASCDHGIIVNRLRRRLRKDGYLVGKDRFRDLYVHQDGMITSLFEVKPDTSTSSIYTAVGQLLIHSARPIGRLKLFFVAPEGLSTETRDKLKKIGIELLGF
jgi:hypothetical protein